MSVDKCTVYQKIVKDPKIDASSINIIIDFRLNFFKKKFHH